MFKKETSLSEDNIRVLLDYVEETLKMFEDDEINETYSTNNLLLKKESFIELKETLESLLS